MKPEKFMNYRCSIDKTDGIACLMMVLKHFGRIASFRKECELELYDALCADSFRTVLPSALANELSSYLGLRVTLSLGDDVIRNSEYYYPADAFFGLFNEEEGEYVRSRGKYLLIRNDALDAAALEKKLEGGALLLVATCVWEEDESSLSLPEPEVRWVVVYGCDNGYFYYSDPVCGNKREKCSDFVKRLKTPLGEICISVCEKKEEEQTPPDSEAQILKERVKADLESAGVRDFGIGFLQRKYQFGFSKAARVADSLVADGFAVGEGSGRFHVVENGVNPEQRKGIYRTRISFEDGAKTAVSPNYELLYLIEHGGESEKINALILAEKDINAILMLPRSDGMYLGTYLIYAVEMCNPKAVELLLKAGADAGFTDYRLFGASSALAELVTALVSFGNVALRLRCAKALLEFGAEPDAICDKTGKNARELLAEMMAKEMNDETRRKYCAALQQMFLLNDAGELTAERFYEILDKTTTQILGTLGSGQNGNIRG